MWADQRRTCKSNRVSWWPWWLALLAFFLGIVVGMRLSGGPLRLDRLLRQQSAAVARPVEAPSTANSETSRRPPRVGTSPRFESPPRENDLPPTAADAPPPPPAPRTRDVFLCKSYAGARFWSDGRCDAQRATIERIVTVPGHLAWREALARAEQETRAAEALYSTANVATTAGAIGGGAIGGGGGGGGGSAGSGECGALAMEIVHIDTAARQPQSAQEQDRLRMVRQRVRSRQAELRC